MAADLVTNSQFFKIHTKIILTLVAVMFMLRALPSPLLISTTANSIDDLAVVRMAECEGEEWCSQGQTIVETVILRKLNPLQRELRYFANINPGELKKVTGEAFRDVSQLNLRDEIL